MARGRLASIGITNGGVAKVYSNSSGSEASLTIKGESLGGSTTTTIGISTLDISPLNNSTFYNCMNNNYIRYSKTDSSFIVEGLVISNNDKIYVSNDSGVTVAINVWGYEG